MDDTTLNNASTATTPQASGTVTTSNAFAKPANPTLLQRFSLLRANRKAAHVSRASFLVMEAETRTRAALR